MKKTATTILLTLGLGTATLMACGGPEHMKGHGHGNGMMKVIKKLDLTSEQKSALKTLRKSNKEHREVKRKEMKENRKKMMASMKPDMSQFMTANTFDKEAFKTQMNKKFEARRKMMESKKTQMLERKADNMQKVFNILTPEQRIKWIELSKRTDEQGDRD